MQKSSVNIKEIRNTTVAGIACQLLPLHLLGLIAPLLDTPGSEAIAFLVYILSLIIILLGYGLCAKAANKYAAYKGYRNPLYIYSILNIFGLSILFLLTNRKKISQANIKEPLDRFSIASIFASYLAIPILLTPIMLILALTLTGGEGFEDYYQNNKTFSTFFELIAAIALIWYFIKEFNKAKINYKHILGSLKHINFKLPIGLAIIEYLFVLGLNPIVLYGLSFVVPNYIENQLNYEYATTPISWIFFSISALIYAPIMEELFFRGIIFQKVATKKGFSNGLIISSLLFAAIHLRYDLISLFLTGVITVLLYCKTKQLTTSIIYHFVYNFIVVARRIYYQLFSSTDSSVKITAAEYQQYFSDRIELYILFLAISIPYLCYFIYKNYPRNYNIQQLPYFANRKIVDESNS